MSATLHAWLIDFGTLTATLAALYLTGACFAVQRRLPPWPRTPREWPPVTVLKPLCGVEAATYQCLRSFCVQAYPRYQVLFGVHAETDAAVAIVNRLRREFPAADLRCVVDGRAHGGNRKVGNLLNMMRAARYDYLVIADSDIRVPPQYLRTVVAPLLDDGVGIVTCAYRADPQPGLWSVIGACFINEWFLPSVRIAAWLGSRAFAFGATIAIRRGVLEEIGGFEALAGQLADDYRLGELTRSIGLGTVLSQLEVETSVEERSFAELRGHMLRWLRTIREVRPVGYALSIVTFGVPVAAIGSLLAGNAPPALAMLCAAAAARIMLHWTMRRPAAPFWHWLVLPLGDLLSLALWCWGFAARSVQWRHDRYQLTGNGSVRRCEDLNP
ncbi:MAG TPA: bacteriohopanetetrol glucosamine biosynthesis glycosyltransferase HpnI [Steroidobacteraceae bacterium]|nr:bacteriohopanetetrol glucosamine biosynthesis glycosyltransferase HpnI [Steroidobacteraceae bacterium]